MTVVVAWKRTLKQGTEELCLASDSRLRDGRTIDTAPKLFPLLRGDICLAFAGETGVAYPFVLQAINASNSFRASRSRGLDIIEYRSHLIKILNQIIDGIETPFEDLKLPEVQIVLAGYSWLKKVFHIWLIGYDMQLHKFHYRSGSSIAKKPESIIYAGDQADHLRKSLTAFLRKKYGYQFNKFTLDYEPLEVLINELRCSSGSSTIGGPPQLVKIYQHINTIAIPIYWPTKISNKITLLGRTLFGYENVDEWVLDPDTFERHNAFHIKTWNKSMKTLSPSLAPAVKGTAKRHT